MNISSSNEEVLEPMTQSEIESGPIAAEISTKKRRRRHAITSEWKITAMRLEAALRPFALRYGKLDVDQIAHIARTAIKENVDDEDIYFRKGLTKAQSNVSTWKHRSLTCMEDYVKSAMRRDNLGLLESEHDSSRLFKAFAQQYDPHDAETVFPWTAKDLMFHESSKKGVMPRGPYWIKAVKTKLFLDAPRAEGTDRTSLLEFYDTFPQMAKYKNIKLHHFKLKPARTKRLRKESSDKPETEEFGTIMDEMEVTEAENEDENQFSS